MAFRGFQVHDFRVLVFLGGVGFRGLRYLAMNGKQGINERCHDSEHRLQKHGLFYLQQTRLLCDPAGEDPIGEPRYTSRPGRQAAEAAENKGLF